VTSDRLKETLTAKQEARSSRWFDVTLEELVDQYQIPVEVIRAKMTGYVVALRIGGRTSTWNDELDQAAARGGLLSQKEIRAAHHDFEQAVRTESK
jgi:hypothetical protein